MREGSVVALQGTSVRPKQASSAVAVITVGDVEAHVPIMVYQPVTSFVGNPPGLGLMAMRVTLARGDTIVVPLPKAAFWVTYFSKDRSAAPPTIELVGQGACTTGNGLSLRRLQEGDHAKYCYTGAATRLMIAHGATGAARIEGVVAIRLMW